MNNSFFYILLCLFSLSLFAYSLWKKRDVKLIILFMIIAGLTYAFEFIILVLFNAYYYYPGILSVGYFDNVLGSAFSNAFTVPMTSVFVAALGLTFGKYILLAAAIVGTEFLFVRLGVYEHHWWSYLYTAAGLILMFEVAKKWYKILNRKMNKIYRFIVIHFISMWIDANLVFVLCGILNIYIFRVQWFENIYRGHIAFATLYVIIQSLFITTCVVFKPKWFYILIGFSVLSTIDFLLFNNNILVFLKSWSIWNYVYMRLFIYGSMYAIDRYLLQSKKIFNEI